MRSAPPLDPRSMARPSDYYEADRNEVIAMVPRGARRFLEVGAARGAFGANLRRRRSVDLLVGVEPETFDADEVAYDQFHRAYFPGDGLDLGGPFDCIFFNDVLEHMPDPWRGLEVARDLLRPGGCVILSLPNLYNAATLYDLAVRGDWPYRSSGVLDVDHLRFFTRRSAERMLAAAGFAVDEFRVLDPLRLPGAAYLKPITKWRGFGFRRLGFRVVRA
jgi:SAM-dependent methyltransferase